MIMKANLKCSKAIDFVEEYTKYNENWQWDHRGEMDAALKTMRQVVEANTKLLGALNNIVKCEIRRRGDLKTLSMRPNSIHSFSDARVKEAQEAIAFVNNIN